MSNEVSEAGAGSAEVPAAILTNKEKNAARLQALKDAKARKAVAAKEAKDAAASGVADVPGTEGATTNKKPRVAKEKVAKTVRQCACGCGGQTLSFFVPGHDARFKGWLKKIELGKMEPKDLPPAVQKHYTFTRRGIGFVPDKDYKGGAYIPQCALEDVTEAEETKGATKK